MPGVFEVYIQTHFSSAHKLVGYPGDCARMHGHNWLIEVHVRCRELNAIGIGIDFRDIKTAVKEVIARMDHCDLNDLPEFRDANPTSENIAVAIWNRLAAPIAAAGANLHAIRVWETPDIYADYFGQQEAAR